ncbi:MAG: 16S rRNA (cytidine(1402)-2'-O)-methyltransferase [Hyphomicrobiaceae bacterium]
MPQPTEQLPAINAERLKSAISRELDSALASALPSALYIVATPIGNLGDVTLRSLVVLMQADRVYCEDTRISQRLLARFDIGRKLFTYHEHNADVIRPDILDALAKNQRIALISDAGTPASSDPGFKLVRAVIEAGHDVVPIPGASAIIAAISAAGLATDRFLFSGFLAQKQGARRKQLSELVEIDATLVFFESPHRLSATLSDMVSAFPQRSAVIARELTKRFEELKRGPLPELAEWSASTPVRGEVTILVAPPDAKSSDDIDDDVIEDRLRLALVDLPPSRAAKTVADALGVPRARVYEIGLSLKRDDG